MSPQLQPPGYHRPLVVCARDAPRLRDGDRVEFVAVARDDGPAEARRVRVYRRMT